MGRGGAWGGGRRGVKLTLDNAPHAAVHADPKPKSKQEKKAERDHHRYHEIKIGERRMLSHRKIICMCVCVYVCLYEICMCVCIHT